MMSGPGGLLVTQGAGSVGSPGSPVKDDKEDSANKPFLERHQDFINDVIKDMAKSKIEEVMDFGSDKKKKDKPKRRGINRDSKI